MKKTNDDNEKLTIYQYEDKYVEKESYKNAKLIVQLIIAVLGVFLFIGLLNITMSAYELNQYFGYFVGGVSVIIFIFCYIVPIAKILGMKAFKIDVTKYNASKAKKYNKALRKSIAEKMVDYTKTVDGGSWYSSEQTGLLELALKTNDDEKIKLALTSIYSTDVNKTAKDMIFKCSVKSGMYSAISQNDMADAMLVLVVNLQLIKDIVFLYGYRPTYPKLVKIYKKVMINSLVAYGLGNVKIGNGVAKTMGDIVKSVPLLGTAVSVLVDSSVQGLTNATLTAIMGYNAIKIMAEEYRLQEILDNVIIEDGEADFKITCASIEKELKEVKKSAKKAQEKPTKTAPAV